MLTYHEINDLQGGEIRQHFTEKSCLKSVQKSTLKNGRHQGYLNKFANLLKSAFLPQGFPQSVSADYLQYQCWDTIQAFASSISGSLATQAVLQGVGVGDQDATPLAATITWLLRHGSGMIGSIVFTWFQGLDLDHNCKKWRLFADVANDFAMCLELSGGFFLDQDYFQYVLCIASVSRALVGVAGGATRTAITQHQAIADNISDVAAKDGSQETLVNLAALIINLQILPLISGDQFCIWTLFLIMTCLHLFANYKAVKSLVFQTFNKDRLLILLEHYGKAGQVPDPQVVNLQESPFCKLKESQFCGKSIEFGTSLSHCNPTNVNLKKIQRDLEHMNFAIVNEKHQVNVILSEKAFSFDLLKAYISAFLTAKNQLSEESEVDELLQNMEINGWDISILQISDLGWRGRFDMKA